MECKECDILPAIRQKNNRTRPHAYSAERHDGGTLTWPTWGKKVRNLEELNPPTCCCFVFVLLQRAQSLTGQRLNAKSFPFLLAMLEKQVLMSNFIRLHSTWRTLFVSLSTFLSSSKTLGSTCDLSGLFFSFWLFIQLWTLKNAGCVEHLSLDATLRRCCSSSRCWCLSAAALFISWSRCNKIVYFKEK